MGKKNKRARIENGGQPPPQRTQHPIHETVSLTVTGDHGEQQTDPTVGLSSSRFATIPAVGALHTLGEPSFSRLLYPNPVCFLTTISPEGTALNVMTISWLTAANNHGGFVFVIHKSRHSAQNLLASGRFTLSVPVVGHTRLLLAIGKCSGRTEDKFDGRIAGLAAVPFGAWACDAVQPSASERRRGGQSGNSKAHAAVNAFSLLAGSDDEDEVDDGDVDKVAARGGTSEDCGMNVSEGARASASDPTNPTSAGAGGGYPAAIAGTVAHMRCRVLSHSDAADAGHHLCVAQVVEACVHPSYWVDGKNFAPNPAGQRVLTAELSLPPLLTFLGSQKFGIVTMDNSG